MPHSRRRHPGARTAEEFCTAAETRHDRGTRGEIEGQNERCAKTTCDAQKAGSHAVDTACRQQRSFTKSRVHTHVRGGVISFRDFCFLIIYIINRRNTHDSLSRHHRAWEQEPNAMSGEEKSSAGAQPPPAPAGTPSAASVPLVEAVQRLVMTDGACVLSFGLARGSSSSRSVPRPVAAPQGQAAGGAAEAAPVLGDAACGAVHGGARAGAFLRSLAFPRSHLPTKPAVSGPIEPPDASRVRAEGYPLPPSFEWCTVDMADEAQAWRCLLLSASSHARHRPRRCTSC